jgi:transcriptional regulator with XRE-family HTH domain
MTPRDLADIARGRALVASGDAGRIRVAARITQREMGAAVGVSPAAIANYETGRRTPRGDVARRYARALDRLTERGATVTS